MVCQTQLGDVGGGRVEGVVPERLLRHGKAHRERMKCNENEDEFGLRLKLKGGREEILQMSC